MLQNATEHLSKQRKQVISMESFDYPLGFWTNNYGSITDFSQFKHSISYLRNAIEETRRINNFLHLHLVWHVRPFLW